MTSQCNWLPWTLSVLTLKLVKGNRVLAPFSIRPGMPLVSRSAAPSQVCTRHRRQMASGNNCTCKISLNARSCPKVTFPVVSFVSPALDRSSDGRRTLRNSVVQKTNDCCHEWGYRCEPHRHLFSKFKEQRDTQLMLKYKISLPSSFFFFRIFTASRYCLSPYLERENKNLT